MKLGDRFYYQFITGLYQGIYDLMNDDIQVILVKESYIPDFNHRLYSDVKAHETTAYNGSKPITSRHIDSYGTFFASNITWLASQMLATDTAQYIIFVDQSIRDDMGNPDTAHLIALFDIGQVQTLHENERYQIRWDAQGIFNIRQSGTRGFLHSHLNKHFLNSINQPLNTLSAPSFKEFRTTDHELYGLYFNDTLGRWMTFYRRPNGMRGIGTLAFTHEIGQGGGGEGGEGVRLKDELDNDLGVFTTIKFVGSDVRILPSMGEAIIQIPPSDLSPFFNQSGALVNNITTVNRGIAAPTAEGTPYYLGDWTAGTQKPTINVSSIQYNCSNLFSIFDNITTKMKVEVIDYSGTTNLAEHEITITDNINVIQNNIRIEIYDFTIEGIKFAAKFRCTINIGSLLPNGGRFGVRITHDNADDGIFTKQQLNLFRDANPTNPSKFNPTFSEHTPTINQISGIKFYGNNSRFNVNIGGIDNINNQTWPGILLNIDGSDFGLPGLNINTSNLNNWTNKHDHLLANYSNNNWIINVPNFFNKGSLSIQSRWIDWVNGAWQQSTSFDSLISTYTNNNSRIFEDFRNELKRLSSNCTTLWDSAISLDVFDDGLGLQAIGSKLIYPQEDFTNLNPDGGSQFNYNGLTGDRHWHGFFYFTNTSKSNGIFRLSGHNITEGDIGTKFELHISLDKLNWFNCSEDYLGGSINHGDGCRINSDTYNMSNNQIRFTLGTGTFTNSSSNWGIWWKIIYKSTATDKYIDSLEITDWV